MRSARPVIPRNVTEARSGQDELGLVGAGDRRAEEREKRRGAAAAERAATRRAPCGPETEEWSSS